LAWETLGGRAAEVGFSGMVGELLADLRGSLGGFGKRRAEDLLEALGELDRRGVISAREAADWIGRMKISQSPGVAAVQVMTVHKSKGLGFDAVILPDIPSGKIPNLQHYKTVSGDGWLTAAPAKWARAMIPELREPEERWCRRQTYEEFCQLYVAMTRAKRGLYILLDPPPKNPEEDKASLPNWIMASLGIDSADNTVFESGCAGWTDGIAPLEPASRPTAPRLGKAIPKRPRGTPSGAKTHGQVAGPGSGEGRRFGTAIHAAFEKIGWIDGGQLPEFPAELRKTMELALAVPEIRALLSKGGRRIDLHLEQRIEAVMNGKWLSGVIDRLHIHRDAGGSATRVEIIDFKTDRVDSPEELTTRYAGQMDAYRRAMQAIHPQAEVICILVSTALMSVVGCE
jgi:ATP-dependent exoDNAse (exonuclease V) beta subunit